MKRGQWWLERWDRILTGSKKCGGESEGREIMRRIEKERKGKIYKKGGKERKKGKEKNKME